MKRPKLYQAENREHKPGLLELRVDCTPRDCATLRWNRVYWWRFGLCLIGSLTWRGMKSERSQINQRSLHWFAWRVYLLRQLLKKTLLLWSRPSRGKNESETAFDTRDGQEQEWLWLTKRLHSYYFWISGWCYRALVRMALPGLSFFPWNTFTGTCRWLDSVGVFPWTIPIPSFAFSPVCSPWGFLRAVMDLSCKLSGGVESHHGARAGPGTL